jgi:hypothetical protein
MGPAVLTAFLGLLVAFPAHAQYTQRWSDDLVLPSPEVAPTAPAPAQPQASVPGVTQPWSTPVYTERRTDAENQEIVDRIVERVEGDVRAGRGAGLDRYQGGAAASLPDQVWQEHLARDRANEAFHRREEEHSSRQRYHSGD